MIAMSDGTSRARTSVASISTASCEAEPELLKARDAAGHEAGERHGHHERGRGDEPPGALEPERRRASMLSPRRSHASRILETRKTS